MSEQETEPVEPIEGDDEDVEGDEDGEQTPAEAAAEEGSAEIAKKLKEATKGYHTRIVNLLGTDMENRICPTCDGFGFADEQQVAQLDGPPLVHPDNYFECSACNGYGVVESGSRNPDYAMPLCTECQGKGYTIGPLTAPRALPTAQATPPVPQAMAGEYDPRFGFKPWGSDEWIPLAPAQGA